MTLAAYTPPSPPTGYVSYVNISLCDEGVRITVRPESADGGGTASMTLPVEEAERLLEAAVAALRGDLLRRRLQRGPGGVGANTPIHDDDCEAMQRPRADCTCIPKETTP